MADLPITKLSGLDVQFKSGETAQGFYVPAATTAQITTLVASPEMRNGVILYNSTSNIYQVYQNGALNYVNTSPITASGVGLNGSPVIYPSGTDNEVEVAANEVNGFAYYGTTSDTLRAYVGGAWVTITTA